MARYKYYAVRCGKKKGVFDSWEKCKESVHGYKGCDFMGFNNIEEARRYCGISKKKTKITYKKKMNSVCLDEPIKSEILSGDIFDSCAGMEADAYVDGSYNPDTQRFSCGFLGCFQDKEASSLCHIVGEIEGAKAAIRLCAGYGIDAVRIHYDFEGIENWYTGLSKANSCMAKEYREYCIKMSKNMRITFHKVKAHSGDLYNDVANRLARAAAMEEPFVVPWDWAGNIRQEDEADAKTVEKPKVVTSHQELTYPKADRAQAKEASIIRKDAHSISKKKARPTKKRTIHFKLGNLLEYSRKEIIRHGN